MSTGLIIAIVVVALILIGLLVLMPRMRAKAREKKAARELEQRRQHVATEHREAASTRSTRAEEAERKAAIAQQNAQAERAEAERLEQEAQLHERGMADDRLIDDHERDRFEPVTGGATGTDDARGEDQSAARQAGNTEYEQGREDERTDRFGRDEAPAAERETRR